jgi:hypothetical protein
MDIRKLLNEVAAEESKLSSNQFIAPCIGGGIRTKVAGIIYTFTPEPQDFEGWGIFQPISTQKAALIEEASLPQIAQYLEKLKPLRLRLAHKLKRLTWLAYPVNEGDMQQRFRYCKPVAVHLVTDGVRFEAIIGRTDGTGWWFDECDRRVAPFITEELEKQFVNLTQPQELHFKGITPEMRTIYDLATQQAKDVINRQQNQDEKRLRAALKMGGGKLQQFRDHQNQWLVEWTTTDGERHTSAISKSDLTVISAGICLSGEDRKFDLQSLVGIVEDRYDDL